MPQPVPTHVFLNDGDPAGVAVLVANPFGRTSVGLVLFAHIGRYLQHPGEIFKTRIKQMPEVAEVARESALAQMRMIGSFISGRRFIAGKRYTIAGITAMVALGLGAVVGLTVDSGLANLTRSYEEVSARAERPA